MTHLPRCWSPESARVQHAARRKERWSKERWKKIKENQPWYSSWKVHGKPSLHLGTFFWPFNKNLPIWGLGKPSIYDLLGFIKLQIRKKKRWVNWLGFVASSVVVKYAPQMVAATVTKPWIESEKSPTKQTKNYISRKLTAKGPWKWAFCLKSKRFIFQPVIFKGENALSLR